MYLVNLILYASIRSKCILRKNKRLDTQKITSIFLLLLFYLPSSTEMQVLGPVKLFQKLAKRRPPVGTRMTLRVGFGFCFCFFLVLVYVARGRVLQ